ncbi:SdiA-regulated domain-containing protein [Niastella populi]|nr:SdiA-regulated domain-containing protein [Niastella populi]
MSKREAIFLITIVVVVIGGFYYYMKYVFEPAPKQPADVLVANTDAKPAPKPNNNEWRLPGVLKEISANVFSDNDHMACIQDNDGIIFIYNLQSRRIDGKIPFAGNGDYEGLAKVQNSWYVLRSDGFLFEVQEQSGAKPIVTTYDLPLTVENETEALCYDSANNRLLVGVKEKDLTEKDKKGVYGFDLKTKKMSTDAVFYLESPKKENDKDGKKDRDDDDKGKEKKKKKDRSGIKPSGIAIEPGTGDLYILDGPSSRLITADSKGRIKSNVQLDKHTFPQPEGLCFSPGGDLYISSEGGKNGQGVIVKFKPEVTP